jgi:PhzF family phenazine biosynthesis protein
MPPIVLHQVDAFAERAFQGNPAAVCPLSGPADQGWMQALAREMNLSETAFVWPEGDVHRLRWFTPAVEVELCGHATLAAAHVLFETRAVGGEEVRFATLSGELRAWRDAGRTWIDLPASLPEPCTPPAGLAAALGRAPQACARSRFDLVVDLNSASEVIELAPDLRALAAIEVRGVIVTAPAERGARADDAPEDYVARFFGPRCGVDEDPVTGSAHAALLPHWAARLKRDELVGYQASDRGGRVHGRLRGDRAHLGGGAVTVARIELSPAASPTP